MSTLLSKPSDGLPESWDLARWNQSLFVHFFVQLQTPSRYLNRLYITGDELRSASGATTRSQQEVRNLFINALREAIGSRSLGHDAATRAQYWEVDGEEVPPFLSHLLLTCMVANDLADEVKSIGDFRKRLTKILNGGVNHGLHLLRPLWEQLSSWLVNCNSRDPRVAQLILPLIPDSGYHSIIGYPLRLSVPSRRDQHLLADLLVKNKLAGIEPPVQEVVALVQSKSSKFSLAFRQVFREFVDALKKLSRTALSQTTFWLAVREIALATSAIEDAAQPALKTRLEMEDDDGHFWLYVTCDCMAKLNGYHSVPLAALRTSPYRYALHSDNDKVTNLPDRLFLNEARPTGIDAFLKPVKVALAEGLILFVEDEDNVYAFTPNIPFSGRLCAVVGDKVAAQLKTAFSVSQLQAEITKSRYTGWSEWREFTAEDLREVDFSRTGLLSKVSSLKSTLPVPQIYLRAGVRAGDSYVSLAGSLPRVDVPDADRVALLLQDGSTLDLEPSRSGMGGWDFPEDVDHLQLVGQHRLLAYLSSIQIAERVVSFVQDVFETRYKRPSTDGRWFLESGKEDVTVYENEDVVAPWRSDKQEAFTIAQETPTLPARTTDNQPLNAAITRLAALLVSQRGISEGVLAALLKDSFNIPWSAVWQTIRAWVENGLLDCMVDLRWRARLYFGCHPTLVAYQNKNAFTAVLTGLVPPYLLQRFNELVPSLGLQGIQRFSASPELPALPCCRARSVDQLVRLTHELELPALNWLRKPDQLSNSVAHVMRSQSPEPRNWPTYKQWDWQRLAFMENLANPDSGKLSLQWRRRDDGPDCYTIYRDGALVWWTRSRTWGILAALTLAGIPAFRRTALGEISLATDGAYLPLPLARFAAVISPIGPGPKHAVGVGGTYQYIFPNNLVADEILNALYPVVIGPTRRVSLRMERLLAACNLTPGPSIPVPVALRDELKQFHDSQEAVVPRRVPLSLLSQLYAELRASTRRTH